MESSSVKEVLILEFSQTERILSTILGFALVSFLTYFLFENMGGYYILLYVVVDIALFIGGMELAFKKAWLRDDFLEIRMLSKKIYRFKYNEIEQVAVRRGRIGRFSVVAHGKAFNFPISMVRVQCFAQNLVKRISEHRNIVLVGENWWVSR